jgi:RHS repeat-associated protein
MDIIGRGFRQEEVVDANGHRTFYTYDAFDRLVWVGQKDDGGWCNALHLALYDYDVVDNLVQVTRGGYICGTTYTAGNITTGMDYDMLGRKEGMDDPDMGAWSYEYDAPGNLVSQTDAKEQTITFAYDDLNRLVVKDLPAGADVYYTYDEAGYGESVGRRTGMSDGSGTTAYYYDDERGRLSAESKTISAAGTFTTTFAYDAMDRVVSMTYPDGEVLTTTYNAQGLPATLTGGSQLLASASYNALGQAEVLTFGNGITTTYQYYPAETGNNRLWKLQVGGGDLLGLAYGYDPVGNVSQLTDTHTTIGGVLAFSYDSLDRLTGVSGAYPAQYAYSALGNLELKAEDGITYTLEYSDANHVHAVSKVNGVSQAYDANGNMILRVVDGVTYSQTWDAENRLIQVISGTQTTQFVYDADGALVKKVVDGETTVYLGNHYEKKLSSGEARTYYYFNGSRVAMRQAGVLQYIVGDHLGTTSLILNADGTVHSEARHYPYGQERWASGTLPTDYRFTGQRYDSTIELTRMGARWYDALGRWTAADTIVPDSHDPQSFNRFSWVRNNPLKFTDPGGHAECLHGDCNLLVHPSTGNIFVRDIGDSALYLLIALTSSGQSSASDQLNQILDSTESYAGLIHTHFEGLGALKGDTGFATEFQDDHLYGASWGYELPASTQTGHFLTAVSMGANNSFIPDEAWIRAIVGHEQVSDVLGPAAQVSDVASIDIQRLESAVALDEIGHTDSRDAVLQKILDPGKHGPLENRRGDSMQDLRLSVRGWRLGKMFDVGTADASLLFWIVVFFLAGFVVAVVPGAIGGGVIGLILRTLAHRGKLSAGLGSATAILVGVCSGGLAVQIANPGSARIKPGLMR